MEILAYIGVILLALLSWFIGFGVGTDYIEAKIKSGEPIVIDKHVYTSVRQGAGNG